VALAMPAIANSARPTISLEGKQARDRIWTILFIIFIIFTAHSFNNVNNYNAQNIYGT
jgi:hypothetical protein